ncbi:hypothetical protein [Agrobacterium rubi]|uniref:Uncharacterized protein n=1 Tax=Agrobacterium rubi TaxID=28099 RepID=A0AAE7R6C6_9HYPH|nr:hypothetical protein [Agrobacterium rubi]NTE85828.1 hypothetical protein [Agrobacterium rubi]NTF01760.1 hypothetical protein [Agrobacterium rubi]NTF36003.1 hypothetical protein [Agrobacterium rubi]OCJ53193.1 hypothetical protein A6U92_24830 [Agrobacterium rubi]QTG01093.1 hypothetical protein G6M88_12175 [Agrobacterium rubi]
MNYTHAELTAHPHLLGAIRGLARNLRAAYNDNPRIARLLSAHQKWLLTQAGMALNLETAPRGFTVAQLRELVTDNGIASRNTVQNYLDQLEIYRYIEKVGPTTVRPRRYRATAISQQNMLMWYVANLAALDGMDGGTRAATMMAQPELMALAQPRAARNCLLDKEWVDPPARVGLFLWTEAGALVMDEFISRIEDADRQCDRIDIGFADARAMASEFMMSRTHLQRLLNKAAEQGTMGWHDDSLRSGMWFSRDFLDEYCSWQAIKFVYVNDAFLAACDAAKDTLPE